MELTTDSSAAGAVFTTARPGEAPPAVKTE